MALPDFEGWAVFAKAAELGSFNQAAKDLGLSAATVSKAVARLETRLGATLFHRTSRRIALTDSGRAWLDGALRLLADGEQLEAQAYELSTTPRGLVRMTAPLSFSLAHLGTLLAEFFALYPDISIELYLTDQQVDLVAEGFDLALRISSLEDSSLLARRLFPVQVLLVGSPAYFEQHGRPQHPRDLANHKTLVYSHGPSPGIWRFEHPTEGEVAVAVSASLRANNADIFQPLLAAGVGLAMQPDFMVWLDLAEGRLEAVLTEWTRRLIALHLVTPPSTIRPKRVQALIDFLASRLAKAPWRHASQAA